jgi:predicted ferric reductase
MPDVTSVVSGLVPGAPRLSVPFATFLLFHVPAGLTSVITGAIAAVSKKRRGRHPRFGTIYYWALAVVFVSATGMAALRWTEDRHLFALGTISFGVASVGYLARKFRWRGWTSFHILGMSLSYIVLLTAFYVDNGPHLPLWDRLPAIAFWTLPSLIGLPLVILSVRPHTHLSADLAATVRALKRAGREGPARKAVS